MAGTGLDRLSVLPSGLANQRQNMPRISIAMSGGPNPAEIIDLVVLAERLGYESAWVAEGMAATHAPSWRPAPCGPRASWGQGHAIFHIPPDSYEMVVYLMPADNSIGLKTR
jgi:hypothetical protein